VDLATTQLLIHRLWTFAQWLEQLLAYHSHHSAICQGALPDMPQMVDFDGFYFNLASNLLAYRAVMAEICQQLHQPLCEVPTIVIGLDAES
jgi:hypothetical protein